MPKAAVSRVPKKKKASSARSASAAPKERRGRSPSPDDDGDGSRGRSISPGSGPRAVPSSRAVPPGDAFARLERDALPMPEGGKASELTLLRRNVRQLYEDARSHILLERDSTQAVVELQKQVGQLQKAFQALSGVLVEEVEGIRAVADRQASEIAELQKGDAEVRALRSEVAALERTQQLQREESEELKRLKRKELERERREARMAEELRELRAAAAHDRATLDKAVRALHSATAAADERVAKGEALHRRSAEVIAALDSRQRALDEEVGDLGDTLHQATIGGVLPRSRPRPRTNLDGGPALGLPACAEQQPPAAMPAAAAPEGRAWAAAREAVGLRPTAPRAGREAAAAFPPEAEPPLPASWASGVPGAGGISGGSASRGRLLYEEALAEARVGDYAPPPDYAPPQRAY